MRGPFWTDSNFTMISLFRNFFQSKIGLPIFIGFLLIVALAFAATDISGSATFGGLSGDDDIAVVGDERITANEMNGAMRNALDRARQQDPTITMPQLIAEGGLEREIDLLIDRYAIGVFARQNGLRAGDNLVNSEILQIGAFRGLTGEFDQATYQAALRQEGITDAELRQDIGAGLLAQLVLRPALASPYLPEAAARQYARLVGERREGQIALIPSLQFAPEDDPTSEELSTFYSENRSDFIVPERRTIRVASFGAEAIGEDAAPTRAQIAARYERDAQTYAARERRAISTFVVPTQQGARALVERIRAGTSLEAAAREAGFQVSSGELRDREALASATSSELAQRVFAAGDGDVVEPARSQLGWYVARVDQVERTPARTLEQARDEIAAQLEREAQVGALAELSTEIERLVDTGSSLSEVAERFDLETRVVPGVTADGRLFRTPGQSIDPELRPILATAFQMDESEPQLAEIVPGQQFLVFDVSDITESAAPPIAEVRDEVVLAWRLARGSENAQAVANRILAEVRSGTDLATAVREENAELTQIEDIDLSRRQLLANPQQRVPAPLALFFSMAQGSTKLLEDNNELGWYVVDLDRIVAEPVEEGAEIVEQTQEQLAPALIAEYNAQLTRAIREQVGIERNPEAIEALRRTLAGES